MPHQNPDSSKATAQNAATDSAAPNDQAREEHAGLRSEPRSYTAPDVADASLAPPAAGEIGDYADEGEALGDAGRQQGRNHAARPERTEAAQGQGRKTLEGNRQRARSGTAEP